MGDQFRWSVASPHPRRLPTRLVHQNGHGDCSPLRVAGGFLDRGHDLSLGCVVTA
jgi:hypothetical protein